jgi:hypothetical protein
MMFHPELPKQVREMEKRIRREEEILAVKTPAASPPLPAKITSTGLSNPRPE